MTESFMTVAELIEELKKFDQNLPVMLECIDAYYNGPMQTDDLETGTLTLIGPHEWVGLSEDERGRIVIPRRGHSDGYWTTTDPEILQGPVVDQRPCLVIRVE